MDIIHPPGCHFSLYPRLLPTAVISETFAFTESCKYLHGDEDQYDYNKLCGLSMSWVWGIPKKAAMFGWRWNPDNQLFEVAPYLHDPQLGRIISEPLAGYSVGETFNARIFRDGAGYVFELTKFDEWRSQRHLVTFFEKNGRQIAGWFGGNKPAPHWIRIQRG